MFYKFYKILKLGATPPTIVYPYPLIPFLAFLLSKSTIFDFAVSLLFVMAYCSAVNLWNHLNDAEIDVQFGRDELKMLLHIKSQLTLLVISLYFLAFVILLLKGDSLALICYIIAVITTWAYSDRVFLGKYIKRFKEHYVSEILTYAIVLPLSSLILWSLFSKINTTGIIFSLLVSALLFSVVMLKDIKDISSDSAAGYKTLAVVLSPRTLLKLSVAFNIIYYSLLTFASFTVFPISCIAGLAPTPLLIYSTLNLYKRQWKINFETIKYIKIYIYSYIFSMILVIFGAIYENFR